MQYWAKASLCSGFSSSSTRVVLVSNCSSIFLVPFASIASSFSFFRQLLIRIAGLIWSGEHCPNVFGRRFSRRIRVQLCSRELNPVALRAQIRPDGYWVTLAPKFLSSRRLNLLVYLVLLSIGFWTSVAVGLVQWLYKHSSNWREIPRDRLLYTHRIWAPSHTS